MTVSLIPSANQTRFLIQKPSQEKQKNNSAYCSIQWRQGKLLVKEPGHLKQPFMTPLENQEYLVKCLKHSPVSLIRIDPVLGEAKLKLWADACEQAKKSMFLYVSPQGREKKSSHLIWQRLRRVTEWLTALSLLILLAPVMLGIMAFIRFNSEESLFERKWHIGKRGRLFRIFKFRTCTISDSSTDSKSIDYQGSFNKLLYKYGLENLPQLFNVIRGEMILFGLPSVALEEAVRLTPQEEYKLDRLPGVISSWNLESKLSLLQLDSQIS